MPIIPKDFSNPTSFEQHLILLVIPSLSKHIFPLFSWFWVFSSYLLGYSFTSTVGWSSFAQPRNEGPGVSALSSLLLTLQAMASRPWCHLPPVHYTQRGISSTDLSARLQKYRCKGQLDASACLSQSHSHPKSNKFKIDLQTCLPISSASGVPIPVNGATNCLAAQT